jgi:hypothetical protein
MGDPGHSLVAARALEALPDAPAPFAQTFVRPDPDRPYSRVLLVAMDTRQLDLGMEAGVEDPEPLTGRLGLGRIPRDPIRYRRVAAAFNGAFKTEHGHYGMMVDKRVLLPPVPGSATVVVLGDGRAGFGTWGAERKVGGIVGVADDDIVSFRQNLDPLIDRGQLNPTGRNLWGFTLPGKGAQTERSALCVTTAGSPPLCLGRRSQRHDARESVADGGVRVRTAPRHEPVPHRLYLHRDRRSTGEKIQVAASHAFDVDPDRSLHSVFAERLLLCDHARPDAAHGARCGAVGRDGGTQPPPGWLPALWHSRLEVPEGSLDLVDIEPGRAAWRLRAGAKEAVLASPLREITGDDAQSVLLSVGMGIAPERRALGLATDGRLAVAVRGGAGAGALLLDDTGRLDIELADEVPPLGAHDDLVELPILIWDGRPTESQVGPVIMRAAIGVAPGGRVIVARGSFSSATPLAEGLARAGCARALSLDRGVQATGFLDRSGTASPPRGNYVETALYVIGRPLSPRAFRFDAVTPADQTARPK